MSKDIPDRLIAGSQKIAIWFANLKPYASMLGMSSSDFDFDEDNVLTDAAKEITRLRHENDILKLKLDMLEAKSNKISLTKP